MTEQSNIERLRQKAASLRRKYGSIHVELANAILALGDSLLKNKSPEEAEQLYRQAANIYDKLGVGHELLHAIALRSICHSLHAQGKSSELEPILQQAHELIAQNH